MITENSLNIHQIKETQHTDFTSLFTEMAFLLLPIIGKTIMWNFQLYSEYSDEIY